MSSADRTPEAAVADEGDDDLDEVPAAAPNPDSLAGLFADPAVRNYLFVGLAAVAMVFVVMFQRGSDMGGLMLLVIGGAGLVLRWPAAPLFFLLVLFWFLVFPFGFHAPLENPYELIEGRFRFDDLMLIMAVTVYLVCHYRIYGLTAQAIPFETRFPRKEEKPPRRPAALIQPGEIARVFYLAAAAAIAGQLMWLFASHTEVIVRNGISFRFAEPRPVGPRTRTGLSGETTRFILLAGLFFFGTMLARLLFGYWRLRQMGPAEARMILQDASWDETRRERARVENWRAWGHRKQQEESQRPAGPGGTR